MAQAIRLMNPEALNQPEFQAFLRRAVAAVPFAAPGGFESIVKDLFDSISLTDNYFTIVCAEEEKWVGVIIGFFPANNLFPYPTITLMYNEGTRAAADALKRKALEVLLSKGYTNVWGFNASEHDDKVYERGMGLPELKVTNIGSVFKFGIK